MNVWLVALLVYISLFVISITLAFIIDTLRIIFKRLSKRGRK